MSVIRLVKDLASRGAADVLVLPFFSEDKRVFPSFDEDLPKFSNLPALLLGDFKAEEGETHFLYQSEEKEPRLLLLGLGELKDLTDEKIRNYFSNVVAACFKKKILSLNLLLPHRCREDKQSFLAICDGLLLSNYSFDQLKGKEGREKAPSPIQSIGLIGAQESWQPLVAREELIASAVFRVRDLVQNSADVVTPQALAEEAKSLVSLSPKVTVEVWNREQIAEKGLGLLSAVSRASANDPVFIQVHYKGAPQSKDCTVLIGKGITYDTGGLSLKPSDGMDTMKTDMAGAAAVLATLRIIALLDLPLNVSVLVPSTENAIGPKSYKPGDVYSSFSGKTVEVANTDAEGRLILADAISYAVSCLKPTEIIDLATLTGSIIVALGEEITGFFSNNDALSRSLEAASQRTGEMVWRMPLHSSYKALLRSDIADIKNVGGKKASAITAALFLEEFLGKDIPWAHLDIAGSSYHSKPKGYHPTNATGVGVRLLVEFLESKLSNK